jgi:hypothetical protein
MSEVHASAKRPRIENGSPCEAVLEEEAFLELALRPVAQLFGLTVVPWKAVMQGMGSELELFASLPSAGPAKAVTCAHDYRRAPVIENPIPFPP